MTEKQEIVIFSSLYMPHLGGVEKYTQSLAGELSRDYSVTVICLNTEKQPEYRNEQAVSVYSLPCFSLFSGRLPIPQIAAFRFVRNFFQEKPIKFCVLQTRLYPMCPWICRFLSTEKIPFIQIDHGAGPLSFGNPVLDDCWNLYERASTAYQKRFSHHYYGVSQASISWLKHFGIAGEGVLSNSINPSDFEQDDVPSCSWRKRLNIPENAVLIVFTGRIIPEKGVLELFKAFSELPFSNVHLIAAGNGSQSIIQQWQDAPRIHFPGQVPFSEIPSLLMAADIFCLPSRYIEGLPTSVLEAGYCGLAVIATNNGGTTEVIIDKKTGILVPPCDPETLKKAIISLIADSELRIKIGHTLQEKIRTEFIWSVTAEKFRSIITTTLSKQE